jgi:hypothetical protein
MKNYIILFYIVLWSIFSLNSALAYSYLSDVYFTVPNTVYVVNETIELKGYVYQENYSDNGSLISSSRAVSNASVNLSILTVSGSIVNSYNFTTDNNGSFYSRSNYFPLAQLLTSPSTAGDYYIKAQYIDPANRTWFSQIEIHVVNETLDSLKVSSEKVNYYPSESVKVNIEAIRIIGDRILYVSNVSISGSLRDSSKTIIQNFNCTTTNNGQCSVSISAPSSYGEYYLELEDFKTFSSFFVIPFTFSLSMKDEFGKSYKNIFASNEQARIEVKISNASSSDIYTFSGYILDSNGNVIKLINETSMNLNNSFTNSFLFLIDRLIFDYGAYSVQVIVSKSGDGSVNATTSFEVSDWVLSINKKSIIDNFLD